MFETACKIAGGYTIPIVVLKKMYNDKCSSGIGAGIIINADGWLLTAGHIVQSIYALAAESQKTADIVSKRAAVEADAALAEKERRRQLNSLIIHPSAPAAYSVYYGFDYPVSVTNWAVVQKVDLALGRLIGFKPEPGRIYPKFKNPNHANAPGKSLCKLGYPFHGFVPIWDAASNKFQFPPGALPIPTFPLEGMFTRTHLLPASGPVIPPPYPLKMIETSTPGLRGQSGGPTFDSDGSVWAVQTHTAHLELGFNPPVTSVKGLVEHQFLNVGMGAHVETILGLLTEHGVGYEVTS